MLFAKAALRNCCIVTAQVTDDHELRAEVVAVELEHAAEEAA